MDNIYIFYVNIFKSKIMNENILYNKWILKKTFYQINDLNINV